MSGKKKNPINKSVLSRWLPFWLLLTFFALLYLPALFGPGTEPSYDIPYTQFKTLIDQNKVGEVVLSGNAVEGQLKQAEAIGPKDAKAKRFTTEVPAFGDQALLPSLEQHGVQVRVTPAARTGWGTLLLAWVPWLVLLGLMLWSLRAAQNMGGGGLGARGDLKKFLSSSTRKAKVPDVDFTEVAGQENAKREVAELVDYLRNPDKYRKLGAEVPHGVLLMGPPGTGKTLLARALAGEAHVPFFSISGSEFIEVFVGVGASRVRSLFEAAKKQAPSIIFIDELDSIGRVRGTGLGGGHDEREQTLNQILAQMDGFEGHEAVIVLAATNRPDVLDPALLRPGRFDRHVTLELPDKRDREAILRVHAKNVPLAPDVDLAHVAATTSGFSGADLKNLINEAAILAAREQHKQVALHDVDEARDKVILGSTRNLAIEPDERHRLAVHEAGHTLVAYFLPHTDPLYKVSIIPRGRALGGTQQMPEQERYTLPEEYLKDRLAVMLGGRTAERELLGTVSSGADDDIRQATNLARAMVGRWGMSETIGPVDLRESEEHPFLGREIAQPRRFSESSAEQVDNAVRDLLLDAQERAAALIRDHRHELDGLIVNLEAQETLEREQIEAALGPLPPKQQPVAPAPQPERRPATAR